MTYKDKGDIYFNQKCQIATSHNNTFYTHKYISKHTMFHLIYYL